MQLQFPTFRRLWTYIWGTDRPFSGWWPRFTTLAQRQSLLRLIAVAAEEKLPLCPLIDAWAADERGAQKGRLRRLAALLKAGTPLPDAVEQVPGILRDEDVLAIRFGAQSGTLATAIREALEASEPVPLSPVPRFRRTIVYGCAVVLVALPIVAFLQVKIVPAFVKILEDFSVPAPEALKWSMEFARVTIDFWWVGALVLIALLTTLFTARPGRFVRHVVLGRLFGSVRELRSADVLQKLSVAVGAGRPIAGALSTLARYHFEPNMRHKLLYVRNEVEQGADVWQSMTAVGLITPPEADLLHTAERVGNRPWVLKQLARGKRRRTNRRLTRLSELFLPAVVFTLAAFVLFQALAVFLPLIEIIYEQL
jgi:type II secretory pathway component PulF